MDIVLEKRPPCKYIFCPSRKTALHGFYTAALNFFLKRSKEK